MKNKKNLFLLLACVLASCNNQNESSGNQKESVDAYCKLYAESDLVYLYGYVNEEPFDLQSIDSSFITNDSIYYVSNNDNVEINDNKLSYKKTGTSILSAYDSDDNQIFTVNVVVNKDASSKYNYYQDIDLNNYTLRSGSASNVTVNNDSITLSYTGSTWTRVTYPVDNMFNKNYIFEADVTINSSSDNTRWLGLVFYDKESKTKAYPYYQFDFRKTLSSSNGIEVTNVVGDSTYSYPYTGSYQDGGLILNGTTLHALVYVNNGVVKGYINNNLVAETNIGTSGSGNIGFQVGGINATFSNVKLSYQNDDLNLATDKIICNADTSKSIVSIATNPLAPNFVATVEDCDSAVEYGQQYYAKAKLENNDIKLFSYNGKQMNDSLGYMLHWYKGSLIPNLEVDDKNTAEFIVNVFKSNGVVDYVIWSKNGEILDYVHSLTNIARLGYIPSNINAINSSSDVGKICKESGEHNAYLIMLDHNLVNKETLSYFTGRGYTLLLNSTDGKALDSILKGASLILVSESARTSSDLSLFSSFASNSLYYKPYATAHRGTGTDGDSPFEGYVENTISSFDKAFAEGALAIEIDVHQAKIDMANPDSCSLAVIHDETTGRVANKNLTVKNSTISQLKTLTLGSTTDKIPTLEEVFTRYNGEAYKDKTMVLEIKDNLYTTGVSSIELAKKYNWEDRLVMISFNASTCKQLHETYPEIPVAYLGTVSRQSNEEYIDSVNTYLSNGVGLSSQFSTVDKNCIVQSNARGYLYWLWTFNRTNNKAFGDDLSYGNRCFTTNNIAQFSKNYYKLEGSVNNNQVSCKAVSYTSSDTINDFEIILVSGNATINNKTITKNDSNPVEIVLRYKTSWKDSLLTSNNTLLSNLYVYSEIITIK